MKLSIEEKQEIYEHLLGLDCPDLLAALIAERATTSLTRMSLNADLTNLSEIIYSAFHWYDTKEESDRVEDCNLFWYYIAEDRLLAEEKVRLEVPLVSDAFIAPYRPPQPQGYLDFIAEQDKVSVWSKVKLFFGKLFYGV